MMTIRLKEIREDKDLKQEEVATALGISQVVYSRYERGIRLMPIDKLDKLADFYDVSVDYLICRTDERKPYQKNYSKTKSPPNEDFIFLLVALAGFEPAECQIQSLMPYHLAKGQ